MTVSSQDTQRADAIAKKNAAALAKLTGTQAANQAKILKDKRLQAALDKATLALGKSSDVFDMDKIQVAAALTSQAEQLGKATSSAQLIQIANDTARLNVKKSISDLEDAIAAKDEKAIIAATKKLNADLGVLNALTGQNNQMKAIETILNGLKAKDLINLDNLRQALDLLKQIAAANAGGGGGSSGSAPTPPAGSMPALSQYGTPLGGGTGSKALSNEYLQYLEDLNQYQYGDLFANGKNPFATSSSSSGTPVTIVNNFGVVGDPNAAAELMNQTLQDAIDRGTLRQYATP